MSTKKLNGYRGPLSAEKIAAGMNAANANALRLAEDAKVLLSAGRIPTAASLAALSIEESGKTSILRELATATAKEEIASVWKGYRSHARKNVMWYLPALALAGARKLEDLRPLFEEDADHPYILDQVKQLGFYTDCLGGGHWSIPTDVVDESLAQALVGIAMLLVGKREVTVQEIELWIEHVGAASKSDLSAMKEALASWYNAMQAHDLLPAGINSMEQFINEGIATQED